MTTRTTRMILSLSLGAMAAASAVLLAPATAHAQDAAPAPATTSTAETPASAPTTTQAVAAADVPTCVEARYENPFGPYQDVYVTNDCPVTVRVKVIWAFARDSACHSIVAGDTYKDHHLNQTGPDRWDGLASC